MKNITVLIDANVIFDYITSRDPFFRESYKIMEMCYSGKVNGYIAFHSVSIIWYSLRKLIAEKSERRAWMKKILEILRVIGADHEAVLKAIEQEDFDDFEDCLQNKCAETVNAQYIITNNVKDFNHSTVPAITPGEFCRRTKI